MPTFAKVSTPLRALTKKNATFLWTAECETAFVELKRLLTTAPVLAYPCFGPDHSFVLETDASGIGLGAVLSQVQDDGVIHPIAYTSRSLDKHERNYGISELETLGLVWAVRYFRPYLLGHPCVVYTQRGRKHQNSEGVYRHADKLRCNSRATCGLQRGSGHRKF